MSEHPVFGTRQQRRAQERRRRKSLGGGKLSPGTVLTLGAALAAVPAAVQGATFTVTNLNDSGAGSLRQAILDANGMAGADTVAFQAGLTGTITLTTGQITITDSVDVQGPGAATLTVSGNNAGRIFYLYNGAALIDVTLSGLTLTGGGGVTFGGAIIDFGENLELDGMTITANTATAGGGGVAATDISGDRMTFTLRNSTISGNDSGRDGGAIYFYTTGGPMLIESSVISGNDAVDDGGAIYLYDITDNLTVNGSTISGNTAGGSGGGIYLYQTDGGLQTIDHSEISGNSAYLGGGILGVFFETPFTIDHSTISGNDAVAGGGMFVVFAYGAPVTVLNSTVSGNQAASGDGGGLFFYALYGTGVPEVLHSTVAGNTGTGLFANTGPVPVVNSIVGDNTPADLGTTPIGNFALSFSLVENTGGASVTDNGGNILGQDPQLGPLANNGGPTLTHEPAATSPAVNAGDPAVSPPATDQRDQPRVAGGRIDMGSVELGAPGTIQLTFSATSVGEAAGTVTITATRTGGSEGAVSVTLNTADGTAAAPGDYTAVAAAVLNWADGDTAPKSVNITLVNDTLDEPDETFTVAISNPTGGAVLGTPATATITIQDDDLAPLPPLEIPTAGEWGLAFLSGLLAMAGLYRLRRRKSGLAAPVLAATLLAGGASMASAVPEISAKSARGMRDARAVTISLASARSGMATLQLSDGTSLQVSLADLVIKDRRGRAKLGAELNVEALAPGQPVVVKIRRNEAGAIKKVRVQVFQTLAQAQAALQRREP